MLNWLYKVAFLILFVVFNTGLSGQIDQTDRTIDLRNNIRNLRSKSNLQIAPNIEAIPVLDRSIAKFVEIPFIINTDGLMESTIIQGDNAESYFLLSNVRLREGEQLTIQSADGLWPSQVIGSDRNKPSGRMLIGPFRGDLSIQLSQDADSGIELQQVYTSPQNVGAMELGFDASFKCHVNINCKEGSRFSDEKRSAMRIRMVSEEGVALCTGTLLNNTLGDREPYVLTAFHCLVPPTGTLTPIYDMWLFDFNYEGFSCANPEEEPLPFSVQGAEKLAEWEDTDMMLLRITEDIPKEANVFYAGWNRELEYEPDSTFLIHHPVGDIKKISIDYDTARIHDKNIGWNNGSNSSPFSHYINDFDEATYQPGSSGASIFDRYGRVLGQLHGGPLSDEQCTLGLGYSGRLSVSWDTGDGPETRLRDWLDPSDFGFVQIDGLNAKQSEAIRFTGSVLTADGLAIPNVRVNLTGETSASFLTGSDGRFVFENLASSGQYQITIEKNTNAGNGLSSRDLVIIRNHIIGRRSIEDQYALRSADVNGDGNISSNDLVQIKNIIIGRLDAFPSSPSWDFEPNVLQMDGTNTPTSSSEVTIIGFKLGDVNYSAKPGN